MEYMYINIRSCKVFKSEVEPDITLGSCCWPLDRWLVEVSAQVDTAIETIEAGGLRAVWSRIALAREKAKLLKVLKQLTGGYVPQSLR